MSSITLRTANIDDLEILKHWDTQPHVIESGVEDWDWENQIGILHDWRESLIAELDGRPIGFMEIIDPFLDEEHYWGKDVERNLRAVDIWIGEKDDLGKGYGTTMMKLALEKCFAPPEVTAVIIDPLASNKDAHRFYERLGFKFVEERSFDEDDCFVYRLEREDWINKTGKY
ncbi:TPA: acetyltransferase [Pseudomonas aeruginosa]|uniref:N-acetyltransferase n=1 Tax=Pseudomonas aeruginosa TaxID=287 RepID=A0A2R4PHE2_PSEAI|nr:N-acetyltransferase [Pseudomonas aeruginosa]HCH0432527.1 acetyltransferase [Pseudomonas aeruginosa]HCH0432780.1 acetyltransferase [Pseudomonas aeruginosa]HCH0444689.1 acetyltransferase [Pseudomonas aeruginosa]HCH0444857.1 acetyltransferase [Pseudomonas aeruginosa]